MYAKKLTHKHIMNSKKTLIALLAGAALTTVFSILLKPYKDSSKRKKIADKAKDYTDTAEETIKDSVVNVKNRLNKIAEDADRMVNEGGNTQ